MIKDILRPIFGFFMLQPIIIGWFMLFSDDWWADYQALGWPLQVVGTIWLIPCYAFYERFAERTKKKLELMDHPPKWI